MVFITAAAAIGGFLFGYDSSVINGAVVGIQRHFGMGPGQTGFVVAMPSPWSTRSAANRGCSSARPA
ncbi:hypothetical protein [Nonomuraea africana]|uniref:hypothetical protein n=1 Tax=Nonomuraea africana TaxID=46171 RepID=UPI0033F07294